MKKILLILCFALNAVYGHCQRTDTFQVLFAFNDSRISKQAENGIDQLIFKDVLIHGQKLMVLGYADYVGDNAYNDKLSGTRAKAVQDYLISSGFDKNDIKICIGKGKIDRANMTGKDGYQPDRKVEIIIEHEQYVPKPVTPVVAKTPGAPKKDTAVRALSSVSTADLKVNSTYSLTLFFENNSSVLLKKSEPQLQELYDFMYKNKTVHIQIEGHICCEIPSKEDHSVDIATGGPVSWTRAQAIYDFLIRRGISKERLSYIGLGSFSPIIYPEHNQEDAYRNRRVEIRILSK